MEEHLYLFEFKIGDKVLAYYDGLLYEATVTRRKISKFAIVEYHVHYKGFKRSWDEWSESEDVLAINEINLAHKERLEINREASEKSRKQRKNKNNSSPKSANRKRGRPKKNVKPFARSAVKPKTQIKKYQKPRRTNNASSPKPANRKRGRPKKNVVQSTRPASARIKKLTLKKSAKLDIQTFSKPAVKPKKQIKKSQKPRKTNNATSPKPANRKRGRPKKNEEQSAGSASARLKKLTVEKSAELDIQTFSKPAVKPKKQIKKSQKPRKTNNATSPKPANRKRGRPKKNEEQSAGSASVQLKELTVKLSDILQCANPYTTQFTKQATAQFTKLTEDKSAELNLHIISEPAVTPKRKKISQEPWNTDNASSPKPKKIKLGSPEKNETQSSAIFVEQARVQLAEPTVKISDESTLQAFEKFAAVQFAMLELENNSELTEEEKSPVYSVQDSAQIAVPTEVQSAEPAIEKSDFLKCTHPYFELNTEPAVRSNRVKKSQEPWTTEDASSLNPAKKKQGSPKKNVEQSVGPASSKLEEPTKLQYAESAIAQYVEPPIAQCVEPGIEKSAESAIQSVSESATAQLAGPVSSQLAEPTTSQIVELAVEKSDESALQTFEDINTTQPAGSSSTQLPKLVVEATDYQKYTNQCFELITQPAAAQLTEPAIDKSVDLNLKTFEGFTKNLQCVEPDVEKSTESAIQSVSESVTAQLVGPVSSQLAEPTTSQIVELAVEKSDESALQTFEDINTTQPAGLSSTQLPKLVVETTDFQKYTNQCFTLITEPAATQLTEPTIDESVDLNLQTFEGFTKNLQCVEPDVEKSTESAIQSVSESATAQLAGPVSSQLAEPTTSQIVELAVEKSDESALQTFEDINTTQPAGSSSTQLPKLVVETTDFQKYTNQCFALITEPAAAQLTEPTIDESVDLNLQTFEGFTKNLQCVEPDVEKSTESAIQSVSESATAQLAGAVSSQLAEPTTSQIVELAVEKSDESALQTFEDINTTQPAGSSSTQLPKLVVETTDYQNYTNQCFELITEPAAAQLTEPAIDKSVDLNLQTFEGFTKNLQCVEPGVEKSTESAIQSVSESATAQLAGPVSSQLAEPTTSQIVELAVEKSDESALQTFEDINTTQPAGPSSTQLPELVVEATDFQKYTDQCFALITEPAAAQLTEPAIDKSVDLNLQTFEEFTKNLECVEPGIEKTAESAIQSVSEPAIAQLAEPTTSQIVELAVEKSDESALQIFEDINTTQPAGSSSTQLPELVVEATDFLKCAETYFALNTEPAVRSIRVKKSQEPWTTEDGSSLNPAKKKRGSQKKNVEQSAGPSKLEEPAESQYAESAIAQYVEPPITQYVEPAVEKSAESAIQSDSEPATAQFAGPVSAQLAEPTTSQIVEDAATSVVGESIPIEKNGEAVQAVENAVINIRPVAKPFAIELFKKLELPPVLKKALEFDHMMNYTFRKVLKFPNDNFVANIIYIFVNSSYFIDDGQKGSSTRFSLTLLQYFNSCVNHRLIYMPEKALRLPKKGLEYFRKRMENRPNINYVFKDQINPKTIWCYLYGPMYLVRLIDALPNILLSNSWFPDYNIEPFVDHIKELSQFLVDNFDTYFTDNDYMDFENSV